MTKPTMTDAESHPDTSASEHTRSSGVDSTTAMQPDTVTRVLTNISTADNAIVYRVYKRRFFGLTQLILLNIVASWNWITFAPVSKTASIYFNTTESTINWTSTVILFTYAAATPFVYYVLNKRGPKTAIIIAASLMLVGNLIKYGGAKANNFGVLMFGQLLIGIAQPFVLSSPTSYSNLWFTASGRTTTTAIASLANPFGAALGQLISPFWTNSPSDIPNLVLYTAVIATVASLPSFFIPSKPPTPPTPGSAMVSQTSKSLLTDIGTLFSSIEFYLLFIPYAVLVGFFNAFSSVLNQILEPYGFTETDAGIAGAILIVVGLVTGAISSPLVDRYKFYLIFIKTTVPILTISYLIFVFIPATRSLPFAFIVCGLLGGASFGLVPVVLEFLVEIHYPCGAESSSSIAWFGGELLGGVFIIVMDALKDDSPTANPRGNMRKALIFEAVLALLVVPLPLCLGLFRRSSRVRLRRWEADKRNETGQRAEERIAGDDERG